MSAIADEQIVADSDPQFAQTIDLGDERDGIDNNAITDHTDFPASEYSRGDQVQNVFSASMDYGVPGIIAALATDDNVGFCGKHIDDLPFPFVAPLGSNKNCVGHRKSKWAKNFPDASGGTHSGLPTNNMLTAVGCKEFQAGAY
jgi:hypothetical protein